MEKDRLKAKLCLEPPAKGGKELYKAPKKNFHAHLEVSEHPSVFQTKLLAENSGICDPHLYVFIRLIYICHASYQEPGAKCSCSS